MVYFREVSEGVWLQSRDPDVTFFFFGYSQSGRTCRLSCVIHRPAGVLPRMLRESIDDDEHGRVGNLIKVKHHVLGGPDWLAVVEPADIWFGHAGHTRLKASHLPVWYGAARDWLDEYWLLANGGFLYAGDAGGDVPLRLSTTVHSLCLS